MNALKKIREGLAGISDFLREGLERRMSLVEFFLELNTFLLSGRMDG